MSQQTHQRTTALALAGVFLLALVARVAAFFVVGDQNFPDSIVYAAAGKELLSGELMKNDYYMPLYPLINGLFMGRPGVLYFDIFISALSSVVIFDLYAQIYRETRGALIAAVGFALYPFFIFYSFSGLTESLFIFLLLLALTTFYRKQFAWGTVVTVAAILVKPSLELIAPLWVILFSTVVFHLPKRRVLASVLIYASTYLVFLAPWWAHQYKKYGQPVRLTLAGPFVLYSGANPMNKSGGGILGVDFDLKDFEGFTDPIEKHQRMQTAATAFIKENPGEYLYLAWLKFQRFWRPWPYAEAFSSLKFILISALSFVPLLLMSFAELYSSRKETLIRLSPILLFFAYLTLVHMATIGSIRYRLPLEPFMILFSAHWLAARIWPKEALSRSVE